MAEVYRARDTKLNREVALKVLPDEFASDPDRVARFEREAQLLASVNHPHIAAIYGIEGQAIVLELVDGPTLSDRIAAGPLSIEDALPIARQIAEALEAAHEKGVVHRDLKPGNIKLTSDGEVKVLDFGLAKLLEREGPAAGMSHSPTLTAHATFAGLILGTAPYMSPEQARGRPVDKRADIWAFGCVLFEMLTGRRTFDAEDVTETLGAVIHKEPPWDTLPRETPAAVRTVLHRCLQKDPKQRLRDIGDARIELSGTAASAPPAAADIASSRSRPASIAGWLVAAVLAIVAGGLAIVHLGETPTADPSPVRFEILPPERTTFGVSPSVSPDGQRVAFTAREATGREVIWVRALDALTTRPLAGTENAANPVFWSPDSRFIGFASGGALKKVDASGGAPVTLCALPSGESFRGGAWSPVGTIIFSSLRSGLWQVADGGGTPSPLTSLEASQDVGHGSPGLLPDGRHFVYLRITGRSEDTGVYLGSLDAPAERPSTRLVATVNPPVFAPSADPRIGYILYLREGTLMAQRFDAERFAIEGDPVPLVEELTPTPGPPGPRPFSAAGGVLAYRTAPSGGLSQLTWFDWHGKPLGPLGPPAVHGGVDLSRDGEVAVTTQTAPQTGVAGVWSIDLARGVFTRVNPASSGDGAPSLSADGRVGFTTRLGTGPGDLFWRFVSGAGEPQSLVESPYTKHMSDWSPDGRFLVYDEHHPTRRQDLYLLPLTGDRKPVPLLVTAADETLARFSPDGKWILYRSDESGRSEIYVRDFAPDRTPVIGNAKWTISSGGDKPRWSRDGKEIYYLAFDRTLMAVPVTIGSTFKPGVAVPLFKTNPASYDPYDVSPDGRFLIATLPDDASQPSLPITVVLNWQALMNR